MTNWRHYIYKYKSVAWLLMAAILWLTVLPAHYHMHHEVSEHHTHHEVNEHHAHHENVIDFHTAIEQPDPAHHGEGVQAFAATPDGIIKKASTELPPVFLLVLLLILLPILAYRRFIRLGFTLIGPKQRCLHFSPPLRAPPIS